MVGSWGMSSVCGWGLSGSVGSVLAPLCPVGRSPGVVPRGSLLVLLMTVVRRRGRLVLIGMS